jgi:nitroimidazol reductase NimA-like FMN-containing flavoprotein (pyridoxamine 5'-phosphate oxidase superfamily)
MTIDWKTGIEILDDDTSWRLVGATPVGRLAISIANHPDIVPVNHVVTGDAASGWTIVFRTAEGTKLAASVLGEAVAYEVDGWDTEAGDAWSVVVKGHAEEIEHLAELMEAQDLPLFPWNASLKPRYVRIVADEVTGRRFHVVDGAQGFRH